MQIAKRIMTKRGDTIVETMFAFAIFGLIAIINIQIMQQGFRLNQSALEISLAREQINSQAEALRLLNSAYIADYISNRGNTPSCMAGGQSPSCLWRSITEKKMAPGSIKSLGSVAEDNCSKPASAFAIDYLNVGLPQVRTGGTLQPAVLYPRISYVNATDSNEIEKGATYAYKSADGIWVEVVGSDTDGADGGQYKYYDFLIRACWDSPSSQVPATLESLVRLYVPN